jgi:hypothetical protein
MGRRSRKVASAAPRAVPTVVIARQRSTRVAMPFPGSRLITTRCLLGDRSAAPAPRPQREAQATTLERRALQVQA